MSFGSLGSFFWSHADCWAALGRHGQICATSLIEASSLGRWVLLAPTLPTTTIDVNAKAEIARAERRKTALDLRREGLSYRRIAALMGRDLKGVYEDVQAAIAAIPAESAEQVRAMELERLDRMLTPALRKLVRMADPDAIASTLKIMDRRAKYLGLDAPKKVEQDVTVNSDAEDVISKLDRIAAEYAAKSNPGSADPE